MGRHDEGRNHRPGEGDPLRPAERGIHRQPAVDHRMRHHRHSRKEVSPGDARRRNGRYGRHGLLGEGMGSRFPVSGLC